MIQRKGIILAGGNGTRLRPITNTIPKCLLPVYDKPMIYYSLSAMLLCEIKDLLIITRPEDKNSFKRLLGDGYQWGIKVKYAVQPKPRGIADALIIGEKFLGQSSCVLMLGDNLFYGNGLERKLQKLSRSEKNSVLAYEVKDPERFGICEINSSGLVVSLKEKPSKPKSNLAVTGLYFYDKNVSSVAKKLKPSKRGELEITDLNMRYMENNKLYAEVLGKGFSWFDAGTIESLLEASNFIYNLGRKQKSKVMCPEEVAYKKKYITKRQLITIAKSLKSTDYGKFLNDV